MKIKDIINKDIDIKFNNIVLNSKDIKKNDLFIPFGGIEDRNIYIKDALDKGCSSVITDKDYNDSKVIKVNNLDREIINIFNKYYNYPLKDIKLIGVTGTDGKTTIANVLSNLLDCPSIGTNGFIMNNKVTSLNNTTPSIDILYKYFNEVRNNNFKNIVMEVSSEAYLTNRIGKLNFDIAIFTNITLDHLDKHKTFDNYLKCKLELFKNSKISILNHDSDYYQKFKSVSKESYSYGYNDNSDLQIISEELYIDKSVINFKYQEKEYKLEYPLVGKFNVYNIAAIILTMLKLGFNIEEVFTRVKNIKQVNGRMDMVYNDKFKVVIDYAHTTNATLNVLKFYHQFNKNIITIVGCAGGRYKEKRKEIGEIVLKYSKLAIFTMDDPRDEDPLNIINDMLSNTKKDNYLKIVNREDAINYAIKNAKDGDLILILGKGCDNYMLIKDKKMPYNDYETVKKYLLK